MVWEFVLGFVVLVAASYVGTTMALRGFFGRERYVPNLEAETDEPRDAGEPNGDGEPGGADGSNEPDEQ